MIGLIADDLTGALDTAAAFTAIGPMRVFLSPYRVDDGWCGSFAVTTENRDCADPVALAAAAAQAAACLRRVAAAGGIAFVKIDSVLRGSPAVEVAAAAAALRPRRVVIAPAFPAQGRITRDGRQWRRDGDGFTLLDPPLAAMAPPDMGEPMLWSAGAAPLAGYPPGAHVCDAETDADLAAVARAVGGAALFVGSAGLAAALAGGAPPTPPPPHGPAMVMFGTRHPATQAQLAYFERGRLASGHTVLDLSAALGAEIDPCAAARAIKARLATLLPTYAPPTHLVAGGGATLAAILDAVAARALDVFGQAMPGIPCSHIVGGEWDGVRVTSKSGGFGAPDLLEALLA